MNVVVDRTVNLKAIIRYTNTNPILTVATVPGINLPDVEIGEDDYFEGEVEVRRVVREVDVSPENSPTMQ